MERGEGVDWHGSRAEAWANMSVRTRLTSGGAFLRLRGFEDFYSQQSNLAMVAPHLTLYSILLFSRKVFVCG